MNTQIIEALERDYQTLYNDFQTGKIDENQFIQEVDRLQFQDEWGRYWMVGAQSGSWHYYDGRAWHQADPREADRLPFMDEEGRYWQRGAKSGDWYYYQPETGEWVKPSPDDDYLPQQQQAPYHSYLQPQQAGTGPDMPSSQFDGELYQDDEGRYWAIGSKTGQWYFYDHNGWHPAHEFQPAQPDYSYNAFQSQPQPHYAPSQSYQAQPSPSQNYQPQPTPPPNYQAQPAPAQSYQPSPPQNYQAQPSEPPMPSDMPKQRSASGSWYYFDGEQWLRYSTEEPEETPPPAIINQTPASAEEKQPEPTAEPVKIEEPVEAELFEEEEAPVEVVDVEVITVIEPEEEEEETQPTPVISSPPPAARPVDDEEIVPRRSSRLSQPDEEEAEEVPPRRVDEAIPRRGGRTAAAPPPQRRQRERTPAESPSARPASPRKKETAREPTIIIPTGSTASNIPVPGGLPAAQPLPSARRRAREDTEPKHRKETQPVPTTAHREMTQPLPTSAKRAATTPMKPTAAARQQSAEQAKPTAQPQPTQKSGYTFGDVLRSLPTTLWTVLGGIILLVMIAIGLVVIYSWVQSSQFGSSGGIAGIQSPTPTLEAGPPDMTPTPGPTVTTTPTTSADTTANLSMESVSSSALGVSMEYPADWEYEETDRAIIFSPSEEGLDPTDIQDTAIWLQTPAENSADIAELLTQVLAVFPTDANMLGEGTINIANQPWTSAQIRFENEALGGQGIASLAVTAKEGVGYQLVAVTPAEDWNSTQPLFQAMINSLRFAGPDALAQQSTPTPEDEEEESESAAETSEATQTPASTPTPAGTRTPVTYEVQSGDTLLGIAIDFGVDVDLLAARNDIDDPASLQLGQELIIPFTDEELAAYEAGEPVAEPTETEAEETEPAPDSEEEAEEAEQPAAPEEEPETAEAEEETAPEAEAAPAEAAPVSGRIAYPGFNPGTNSYDLWVADLATGEQTILTGGASQPDFSADGNLLAYRSWNLDSRGVFFIDFVGGRGGQVTRFVEDGLPAWLPDGSFVFVTRREGDRVPRLYIGNQTGEGNYSIGFHAEYVDAFPDGRLVAKGCSPSGDCGLYVMGTNGGNATKISNEVGDSAPSVSPDGGKVAFMSSSRDGATNWEIWVMNADGSNPQRLTENGSNEGLPTWSPDGRTIAFVSDQGGFWAIWGMNPDGSSQRKLADMNGSPDGQVLHDIDNSRGWLEERISWAP